MSSYDERNIAQIRLDNMIEKYKIRLREAQFMAKKYKPDEELAAQLVILLSDLQDLKKLQDTVFKTKKVVISGNKF